MTHIAMIVPRLPPALDGVADYSHQIYQHWPECDEWVFVVAGEAQASRPLFGTTRILKFDRDENALRDVLEASDCRVALLQYSGYPYDPACGAPFWLPAALDRWQSGGGGRKLLINFHETWASGKPWQKVYWQQRRQKMCAKRLLEIAGGAATSNPASLRQLKELAVGKPISLIPIGSNVLVGHRPAKDWRKLLIFGIEPSRLRSLRRHTRLLRQLAASNIIEAIVLAGESPGNGADRAESLLRSLALPIRVETAYNFAPCDVPTVVTGSGLSLMHTQSTFILKSGCFQLAAHLGQVAIMDLEDQPGDLIVVGKHALGYTSRSMNELKAILRNETALQTISHEVSRLAAGPMSWDAIARSWSDLVRDCS